MNDPNANDPNANDPNANDPNANDPSANDPNTNAAGCDPLEEICKRLLAELRERCPGLLPPDPLPPGTPGAVVPVNPNQLTPLITTAIAQAVAVASTGRLPAPDQPPPPAVLWRDGIDALLVIVSGISVKLQDGVLAMIIPVACDQLAGPADDTGAGVVVVELHLGTPDRPTGLLAATPMRPDGPDVVVDRWGTQLTALAWRALLDAAGAIAAAAGRDTDGAPLVPVALTASANGLGVLPQARHPFDRALPTQVVR